MSTKTSHLDYVNSQVLLIGESSGLDKAMAAQKEDEEKGLKKPREVLEHLEQEDQKRMKGLSGDQTEAVFADLETSAKGYPRMLTTF